MAHSMVYLQDPLTSDQLEAPVGFSWTCLFFGFLLFAYRGDWWVAWISLFVTFLLGPLPNIIMCWGYNEWYLNRKLRAGYHVIKVEDIS
jgi:hypothetical protein